MAVPCWEILIVDQEACGVGTTLSQSYRAIRRGDFVSALGGVLRLSRRAGRLPKGIHGFCFNGLLLGKLGHRPIFALAPPPEPAVHANHELYRGLGSHSFSSFRLGKLGLS